LNHKVSCFLFYNENNFLGTIAKGLKTVFVNRENRDDKNSVLQSIQERANLIKEGKSYPQILVFPEGTTTNGDYIISFKKGAFFTHFPVQIVCLKYKKRYFNVAYDVLDYYVYLLVFLQLKNELEVIILDVYYPSEDEKNWEVFAQNVKTVMVKALNVQSSNSGFEDQKEYYQRVRMALQKKNQKKEN
jgi:lysophosphatidylcholine acyltransferase/lyso-PAF acetyltransferase